MTIVINEFYTMHRPKNHSAHRLDGKFLVRPQPTEIELVQGLGLLGVNLRRYKYFDNCGDEKFLTINWVRADRGRSQR